MIAKFDTGTAGLPAAGSGEKGGNGILYLAIAAVGGYLLWQYVIKPEIDKRKAEKAASQH